MSSTHQAKSNMPPKRAVASKEKGHIHSSGIEPILGMQKGSIYDPWLLKLKGSQADSDAKDQSLTNSKELLTI